MQIDEALQSDQNFCVEWLEFYFVSNNMILLQPLESTGHLPLSNISFRPPAGISLREVAPSRRVINVLLGTSKAVAQAVFDVNEPLWKA